MRAKDSSQGAGVSSDRDHTQASVPVLILRQAQDERPRWPPQSRVFRQRLVWDDAPSRSWWACRTMSGGQPLYCRPVTGRQGQVLAPRPTLDLALARECLIPGCEHFLEDKPHRQPRGRISGEDAHSMPGKPGFQIVCMSRIDRAIRTAACRRRSPFQTAFSAHPSTGSG